MKRKIALFIVALSLLFSISIQSSYAVVEDASKTIIAATQTKSVTVYITKTGKKYHKAGCRHLKQSKISIKLKDAKANGYEPCKVCKPPR